MYENLIPTNVLASATSFFHAEPFFFEGYVDVRFRDINMIAEKIGCCGIATMPSGDEITFMSYAVPNYPLDGEFIRNKITTSIKKGKKKVPYDIDLNLIHSSIKLKHKNTYRNNMTFLFNENELHSITLNQSVVPNGSDEVNYLLYSSELQNKYPLDESNMRYFYVFHYLMEHTGLKGMLTAESYFEQFEEFMEHYHSDLDLLKMHEI